nr:hypothetical protein [Halomonas sp.]
MAATIGTITSLTGLVGVVVTTPTFCQPAHAQTCLNAASKAAGLAAQGVITAGGAGLMIAGARAIDPEV